MERASDRRAEGTRGAAVDFAGNHLDRSHGGAFSLARPSAAASARFLLQPQTQRSIAAQTIKLGSAASKGSAPPPTVLPVSSRLQNCVTELSAGKWELRVIEAGGGGDCLFLSIAAGLRNLAARQHDATAALEGLLGTNSKLAELQVMSCALRVLAA